MCGILAKFKDGDKYKFKESLELMKHRGPDNTTVVNLSDYDLRLGHNRLSILDTSELGNQPIRSGGCIIVFNGEIYNFKELKEKYEIETKSNSDTEVILELYRRFGSNVFCELDGEFAILIVDGKKEKLVFVRDSLGIKPLYYHQDGESIIISSEIKSISKWIKPELNEEEMKRFMLFGYSQKNTLFKGIKKALPGLVYEFDLKTKELKSDLQINPIGISKESSNFDDIHYTTMLAQLLWESVERRMISDVPISATLSGGLDSSIIVGIMSKLSKDPIKTYSISIGNQEEDLIAARKVAKFFKTNHKEIRIPLARVYEDIEKIIAFAEEPMDKGSLIPTYYLAQVIDEKVTLIGEGADECFGGYKRHNPENLKDVKTFKEYFDKFIRLFPNEHDEKFEGFDTNNWNTILLYDLLTEIPNFHNLRIDKMFMSQSVEARVPYLDPKLVNFALDIPYKYKVNPEKKILREAFKDLLPEEIYNRKKSALKIPYAEWVERDKIKDVIMSSDILPKEEILKLYENSEIRNRSRMLWYIYLITQWKNTHFN